MKDPFLNLYKWTATEKKGAPKHMGNQKSMVNMVIRVRTLGNKRLHQFSKEKMTSIS